MLNPEYSIHKISTGLSLSHAELKKRIAASADGSVSNSNQSHGFVAIDIPPIHSAECIIEMEHRSGKVQTGRRDITIVRCYWKPSLKNNVSKEPAIRLQTGSVLEIHVGEESWDKRKVMFL